MDIDRVFRNFDTNKSNEIDLDEFSAIIKTLDNKAQQSVIEVLFFKYDKNNDGAISLKEFR